VKKEVGGWGTDSVPQRYVHEEDCSHNYGLSLACKDKSVVCDYHGSCALDIHLNKDLVHD
jgi:hypothetical protein